MGLDDFIESRADDIIEKWKEYAKDRLSLNMEESALVDHLPHFIDDVVKALRSPSNRWPHPESAEKHGKHRMQLGMDVGGLTEEIALLGETILELAFDEHAQVTPGQTVLLLRVIGRGAGASVAAYAALRDRELANQAARHFAFIAHEIRTPLQNAQLAAKLLQNPDEAPADAMQQLDRSLSQLADLVDNALLDGRVHGELELHVETVQAEDMVEAACQNVAARTQAKRLDLTTETESFELQVDRRLLASALTNLLVNAVKFCPDGGRIAVRARPAEDRAIFEVEDECGGIPENLVPRLFQPFAQAGEDRTGFGLGLAIVKRAAEAHGGAIRLVNRPPVGCCFVLELPRRHGP